MDLTRRGYSSAVPILLSPIGGGPPYWKRHSEAVRDSISELATTEEVVLVAHSGAGPLLPALGRAMSQPVAAYVFVDAGLPEDGKSRFDLFADQEAVEALRSQTDHGMLPPWNRWFPDGVLAQILPDDAIREAFVSELRPTPLVVYEEPLPVFAGWPDAPCAYLQLSDAYRAEAAKADELGWQLRRVEGGHLHMLVDPSMVAGAILELVTACSRSR